jgi:hypothetical protein
MSQAKTNVITLARLSANVQAVPKVLLGEAKAPQRPLPRRRKDPALLGVLALVEGLRAGQAELERLGWEGKATRLAAKAERRQETRTKLAAFSIYYLLAAVMVGMLYAGAGGLG